MYSSSTSVQAEPGTRGGASSGLFFGTHCQVKAGGRLVRPKSLESGLHLWGSPTSGTLSKGLSPESGRNHACFGSRRSSREGGGQEPLPQVLLHEQNLEAKHLS